MHFVPTASEASPSRASSRDRRRALSRERSRSPSPSGSAVRRRSSAPVFRAQNPRHSRTPSGDSYDNAAEALQVIKQIIEEARLERIEGITLSSPTSLWGAVREFFRYVFQPFWSIGTRVLTS